MVSFILRETMWRFMGYGKVTVTREKGLLITVAQLLALTVQSKESKLQG